MKPAYVHLTLKPESYLDKDELRVALQELRIVGRFSELDDKYAAKSGVVQGALPVERIADVRKLQSVEALTLESVMSAF